MVGRGEVALQCEAIFEHFVVVELSAVVERDRLEPSSVATDGSRGRSRRLLLRARLE